MNNKYNPTSKEFQEKAKELGLTGYQLTQKYREEGKIISTHKATDRLPKVINAGCKTFKEYRDKCAQNIGYKDFNEWQREWRYKTGRQTPAEDSPECSLYFGIYIAENYIIRTFDNPIKMPPGNPGFDWICNKGLKIESKARCLRLDRNQFTFTIDWNNIADWFIFSGWNNRESLKPLFILAFHKNDIVRGKQFWKRDSLTITNTSVGLSQFVNFMAMDRLEKLTDICNGRTK